MLLSSGFIRDPVKRKWFKEQMTYLNIDNSLWKLAYIPTASMAPDPESTRPPGQAKRKRRYEARVKSKEISEALGVNVEIIDLEDYSDPDVLEQKLSAFQSVYVGGGNTFYLQHFSQQSGFSAIIPRLVKNGMIYIGVSAGAIIAGKTIATAFWKGLDSPDVVPGVDWSQLSAVQGMDLTDNKSFLPHYDESKWKQVFEVESKKLDHTCIAIKEDDFYLAKI
eukprot:CAMPEP_0113945024 /NCGR_PEP_ID=MMETSP1339-20121228/38438_1 /TAXON_ID=94617 /ORGANISM="Fibrocapsa japonica" /LENGTH=221 /DNA_ID=CAMNT_0000950413 /DNA_START=199 /DNA_END=864 /DNA_ORIENTATION=- /assembly_acc=CAM_ASM_000762